MQDFAGRQRDTNPILFQHRDHLVFEFLMFVWTLLGATGVVPFGEYVRVDESG